MRFTFPSTAPGEADIRAWPEGYTGPPLIVGHCIRIDSRNWQYTLWQQANDGSSPIADVGTADTLKDLNLPLNGRIKRDGKWWQ
jgi:hypothetical protein